MVAERRRLRSLRARSTSGRGSARASAMARMVQCVKLGREAEGLDKPPFKGEFGQKIFDSISKDAWRAWLEHSKMLINEFRLDLTSEMGQKLWMTECEKYFWGEGAKPPPDFVPPPAGGEPPKT